LENKEILFVTGNAGKVTSLNKYMPEIGYKIIQMDLSIIEPQADTVEEVCLAKAKEAYAILGKSLVVNDSGFCIDELNDFPGPYTKYVIETIGAEGIVRMMDNLKNRNCHFVQALTYVDENGQMKTFSENSEQGIIAKAVDPDSHPDDWSDLWRIYIPNGYDKTLNQIIGKDDAAFHERKKKTAVFSQFADYLAEK